MYPESITVKPTGWGLCDFSGIPIATQHIFLSHLTATGRRERRAQIGDDMCSHAFSSPPLLCCTLPPSYPRAYPSSLGRRRTYETPSTSAFASGLGSSRLLSSCMHIPTNSQSQSQHPREKQQLQLVCTWSAHISLSGLSPSPFPRSSCPFRDGLTHYRRCQLFLSGGHTHGTIRNGLYVISTRDVSTTLLQTSGQVPNARYGHRAALTSTVLLIWGGITSGEVMQNQDHGDSFWLLNLGTLNLLISIPFWQIRDCVPVSREWARIKVNSPGPGGRYRLSMTLVDSKLFDFGGQISRAVFNDIWTIDWSCCTFTPRLLGPF